MENREAFITRLEPHFAPSDILDVQVAYTLAKFGHRSQVRKDEKDVEGAPLRYFEHVRRVALVLIDEVKIFDRDMVISGLLHDGIEDTRDLTPEMIEHCFGTDVVRIVKMLSKVPKAGYLDRLNACRDWRPLVLKGCDRLDNLRSMFNSSSEFKAKQVAETEEHYMPLFDRMLKLAPSEHEPRVRQLRDSIIRTLARHQAALGDAS